jgi:hypothetical protein
MVKRQRPRTQKPANTNPRGAASRFWRASLIRKRAQIFGDVEVPIREAAEAAAFQLSAEQRSRLVMKTLCDLKHLNLYAIVRPPSDALVLSCPVRRAHLCPLLRPSWKPVRRCLCNGPAAPDHGSMGFGGDQQISDKNNRVADHRSKQRPPDRSVE